MEEKRQEGRRKLLMHHPWKYVGGGDMVSPLEVGAMVRWAVAAALANCCVGDGSTAVVMGPVASCFYDGSDDDVGRYR